MKRKPDDEPAVEKKRKKKMEGEDSIVSKKKFRKGSSHSVRKKNIDVVPVPHKLSTEERDARQKSLYRPPTSEELNELKQNENLYKNNLFCMQMTCLLDEVRMTSKTQLIDAALHDLHAFIKDLRAEDGQTFELKDPRCRPTGIEFPIGEDLLPSEKMKGRFMWQPPTCIKVVGSFLLKAMTKPNRCVDLLIEMPKACFQDKDHLNFRYHYKRALYLCYLAKYLADWKQTESLRFSLREGDPFKPSLIINLKGKLGRRYSIKIVIGIPVGVFKFDRFAVEKNNVRPAWFDMNADASLNEVPATPHYNSSVLLDMLHEVHLRAIFNALNECPGMRDAICLAKVWLMQRSFQGNLLLNGFVISFVMVHLLQQKKISSQMSSYQIFRMLLNTIASCDWSTSGVSLCDTIDVRPFHDHFDVVFVDSTGYLNLLANVDGATYKAIRREAISSLQYLDDPRFDSFSLLFMTRFDFSASVDHVFRIGAIDETHLTQKNALLDRGGFPLPVVTSRVMEILERGLSERVEHIVIKPMPLVEWSVDSCPVNPIDEPLCIGLCLRDNHADKIMELGPSAEDSAIAADFRAFWGSRSELRRFQDGSIKEAIVWKCDNQEQKKAICKRIVLHLLELHLHISSSNVSYQNNQFNSLLKYRHATDKGSSSVSTGEETARHFVNIFRELQKQIRGLADLPLAPRSIDGVDDVFSCTGVLPPLQHLMSNRNSPQENGHCVPTIDKRCPTWCPAHTVVMQLEASSKWPSSDLLAIRHIKSAFHIRLAHSLMKQCSLPTRVSSNHVDVFKDGYVFRIHIVYAREVQLYRDVSVASHLKLRHEQAANQMDVLVNHRPAHQTFISSLSGDFHAYAETTRLAKRWIASQMLSDYVVGEAVELVVAHLFLSPAPLRYPRAHISGFLRFLKLMSTFEWKTRPLIVNFNHEIDETSLVEIQEQFTSNREHYACVHIITQYDRDASIWTKTQLPSQIVQRVTSLASQAYKMLESSSQITPQLAEQLFRPSLRDYHVVIKLDAVHVPHHFEATSTTCCVKQSSTRDHVTRRNMPVIEFDPVRCYLDDIKASFSTIALFFHDPHGGLNIGLVWREHPITPRPFKILNAAYQMISTDSEKMSVLPNIPAVLSDLRTMGRGLVLDVISNK